MFSTKLKIIFTVFGIIAILFLVQAAVTFIQSEKKRENFENEDDDGDEDSSKKEKEKKKDKKQKKEKKETDETFKDEDDKDIAAPPKPVEPIDRAKDEVRKLKLSILESVENVFDKQFPGSEKKAAVFDHLLKKETFEEIKDKNDTGRPVNDIVQDMIYQHMKTIEKMESQVGNMGDLYTTPGLDMLKPKEKFQENKDMEALKDQIKNLVKKVEEMEKSTNKASSKVSSAPATDSKSVIEGFENRYNYAAF